MFTYLKRIIRRMLDFYRRVWQAFLILFGVVLGVAFVVMNHIFVFVIILILALICLIIALIGLRLDYLDARRKEKEANAPSVYEKKGLSRL